MRRELTDEVAGEARGAAITLAPALTDLLGGQVDVMFDNMPSSIEHIRAGRLRTPCNLGHKWSGCKSLSYPCRFHTR